MGTRLIEVGLQIAAASRRRRQWAQVGWALRSRSLSPFSLGGQGKGGEGRTLQGQVSQGGGGEDPWALLFLRDGRPQARGRGGGGGMDGGSEGQKALHPALVRILSFVPELLGREGAGEIAQNVHCP